MATNKQLGGAAVAGSVWCHWGVARPATSARSAGSYFLERPEAAQVPGSMQRKLPVRCARTQRGCITQQSVEKGAIAGRST